VATSLIQLIQVVVVARYLSPQEYGVVAMVWVVLGLTRAFADMGLSGAVVVRRDQSDEILSSLYWANVMAGGILALLLVAGAPLAASFFHEPALARPVAWLGLIFVLGGPGQLHQVLAEKQLVFAGISVVEVVAAVVGLAAVTVALRMEFGVLGVVWAQAIAAGTRAIGLIVTSRWRPGWHFSFEELHGYLGFGIYQMGERSINYFSANVDYLLIGRYLGSQALGVYSVAYQLAVFPLLRVNPVLTRVAFPAFARKSDDHPSLVRGYLELSAIIAFVAFPLLIGLAVTAPTVVTLAFGAEWLAAVPVLRVLAVLGIAKMLHNPAGAVLLAKGRADIGFWWNVAVAAINAVVLGLVVRNGPLMVALVYALLSTLYLAANLRLLDLLVGLRPAAYLRVLVGPATFAAAMALTVTGLHVSKSMHSRPLPNLVMEAGLGGAVYLGLWWLVRPGFLHRLTHTVRGR
jgi:O-antigen/teichoic acid export membrane protein